MPRREKNTSPWDITPEVISEIKYLVGEGCSKRQLGSHFRRAERRVSQVMKENNIVTYRDHAAGKTDSPPPMTREQFIDMQKKWGYDSIIARYLKVALPAIVGWRKALNLDPYGAVTLRPTPKTITLTENEIAKLFNGQRFQDMRKKNVIYA